MNVVVAGGSGFIGRPLVRALLARGADVAVLSRDPAKVREGRGVGWAAVGEAVRAAGGGGAGAAGGAGGGGARGASAFGGRAHVRVGASAPANRGGTPTRMRLPAHSGGGGGGGSGRQWMSWIDRDDVVRMILWALDN